VTELAAASAADPDNEANDGIHDDTAWRRGNER